MHVSNSLWILHDNENDTQMGIINLFSHGNTFNYFLKVL